jgi:uncharacterized membrane protein
VSKKDIENHHHQNDRPTTIFAKQHVYSSPLPPPDILAQYEHLQSGLIQKVISMTETQANHRRELESKNLDASIKHQERRDKEARMGQFFAFLITLVSIAAGAYLAIIGREAAGSVIGAIGLGIIVTAFIKGRQT